MRFLFTFATTTSAFKAEKALKEFGLNASVEAVPFELSKTCYGLGVSFEADEFDSAVGALSKEEIEWLRLWNQNNAKEYVLVSEKGK